MRREILIGTSMCLVLGLASCGPEYDPTERAGLFHATAGTNRADLTLMAASPADLVRGTGTSATDGQVAAAAVERYRNDKVKKLPQADIAQISSGANNSSGGQ
jgi:type IV pilus biogenesis protein CpaD/CtpE